VWCWWHTQQLLYHSFLPTVCQYITTTIVGRLFPHPHHPHYSILSICEVIWSNYMLLIFVYPEWNAILQLLDHFEAHTLPFSTDLNTDTRILHTILQHGRRTHDSFSKKWKGTTTKALYLKFVFPFDQSLLGLIGWHPENIFNRLKLCCCARLGIKISCDYLSLHGWALEESEVYVEICH